MSFSNISLPTIISLKSLLSDNTQSRIQILACMWRKQLQVLPCWYIHSRTKCPSLRRCYNFGDLQTCQKITRASDLLGGHLHERKAHSVHFRGCVIGSEVTHNLFFFYHATLCISAVLAVDRCPSVRHSCIVLKWLKIPSNFFSIW